METKKNLKFTSLKQEESILKQIFFKTNWQLVIIVFALTLIGFIMIYSATFSNYGASYLIKQFVALIIGLSLFFMFSIINYQLFQDYYIYLYYICLFLLVAVLLIGTVYRNTRAWIDFKFFSFQPSEIVRILFILFISGFFSDYQKNSKFSRFLLACIYFGIIAILLLLEPDFSAVVLYFPILVVIFYLAGVNKIMLNYILLFSITTIFLFLTKIFLLLKHESINSHILKFFYLSINGINIQYFLVLFMIALICFLIWWILKKLLFRVNVLFLFLTIIVLWFSYTCVSISHKFIRLYQQKRIIALLDPYFDPSGSGYQVIQTKIAIGSGRIFGKGLFRGTQTKLGFVPEKHTDFIFSLISEEFGFIGSTLTLLLYLWLILEGIRILNTARDFYGSLVSAAITVMFCFYFFINVGMCLGIVPVIGIPLPFISYGGSNLIASYFAVGILNSIYIRRYIY